MPTCALQREAFVGITGVQAPLWVEVEGHGRGSEHGDFAHTVGWFTKLQPVCIEAGERAPRACRVKSSMVWQALSTTLESLLEIMDRCRSEGSGDDEARQAKRPSISFNFYGQAWGPGGLEGHT